MFVMPSSYLLLAGNVLTALFNAVVTQRSYIKYGANAALV